MPISSSKARTTLSMITIIGLTEQEAASVASRLNHMRKTGQLSKKVGFYAKLDYQMPPQSLSRSHNPFEDTGL